MSKRHFGKPIAHMPMIWYMSGFLMLSISILSIVYLTNANYARKEKVIGWLVPKYGVVKLPALELSLVESVHVREGQIINKSDAVFTLVLDHDVANIESTIDNILHHLSLEREQLIKQELIASKSFELEQENLINEVALLEKENELLSRQMVEQRILLGIAEENLKRVLLLLDEKQASQIEVDRQREILVGHKKILLQLRVKESQLERQISNISYRVNVLPLSNRKAISELKSAIARLDQRVEELRSKGRVIVSSPIKGLVSNLNVKESSIVSPGTILASVLPADTSLIAELFVPTNAVGFIENSQLVNLMFSAFPHQRFGFGKGTITSISKTILTPEELPTSLGLKEPAYRVVVQLQEQELRAYGKTLLLRPGMTLTAEIIQENRSFLDWILEPLNIKRDTQIE